MRYLLMVLFLTSCAQERAFNCYTDSEYNIDSGDGAPSEEEIREELDLCLRAERGEDNLYSDVFNN